MFNRLIIICLIAFASCATTKVAVSESSVLTFEKTPCFGRCPTYKMTIQGNGKCILVGEKNTAHIGHFEKQLTKEEVTSIFTDLKNAGYDTLQEKYLSRATDLPMTIYSLTENGKTKSVTSQQGQPESLIELDKRLSAIAEAEDWKQSE